MSSAPHDVREARLLLGQMLAALRRAAGYTQHDFAPRTHYGRSTIANVETGRQQVDREFWRRCDALLNADGALVRQYDQVEELARRHHRQQARIRHPRGPVSAGDAPALATASGAEGGGSSVGGEPPDLGLYK